MGVYFAWHTTRCKEHSMLDVVMLAIGLGFFALSVGYTIACDRL
jgi:SNF family Na+-dependent transporter